IGRWDDAIAEYEQAARLRPDEPVPQRNWAEALIVRGKATEAMTHFRQSLELASDLPETLSAYAWVLAAHADAAIRNPPDAVRLPERAAALTASRDARVLDILSMAYAAAGRFDRAIATARGAAAAVDVRDRALAARIDEHLRAYETHRPYVQDFSAD